MKNWKLASSYLLYVEEILSGICTLHRLVPLFEHIVAPFTYWTCSRESAALSCLDKVGISRFASVGDAKMKLERTRKRRYERSFCILANASS